jgi:hypothetical protein
MNPVNAAGMWNARIDERRLLAWSWRDAEGSSEKSEKVRKLNSRSNPQEKSETNAFSPRACVWVSFDRSDKWIDGFLNHKVSNSFSYSNSPTQ